MSTVFCEFPKLLMVFFVKIKQKILKKSVDIHNAGIF